MAPDIKEAATIIDWSLKAKLIRERDKPLSPKTLQRITKQLEKYKNTPFISSYYSSGGAAAIDQALPTITTHEKHALVIPPPFLVQYYSRSNATSSVDKPLPTITTNPRHALAIPSHSKVEDCGFRMLETHELKLGI